MRHFKTADLLRQGAGEGSSLVAEQLAFEQPGRNGGTVQGDEREDSCADSFGGWRARPIPCPVPVSPRINTVASVGATTSTCRMNPLQCRAASDNLLEVCAGPRLSSSSIFSSRSRSRRSCTNVIHRNGESFKHCGRDQNRAPGSRLCESTLFQKACRRRTAILLRAPVHRDGAYSGGVRSGQCSRPACKSSRL